jgi:microsomal dipeptidase-like Zn-dependent dipeptidase
MDETVANHGLRRALCAADLEAAHKAGQPAIVADVEGLDFLDGKLERLEEAHQRGIRHLQLVHYTPNDIGDFQTGAITHQGLTAFGAEVIRACHRLGFVCDVAHATEDMVKQAVKIATKPLLLSHTALSRSRAMGPTPLQGRQITSDHARAIAETGGSIGIWHFFSSLDKYVDGLKEMAEIVGVDHVSIGTDQHVTPNRAGLHAMGAPRCGNAARRLHPRGGRKDRGWQLYADLSRCGRLTFRSEPARPEVTRKRHPRTCGRTVRHGYQADPSPRLVGWRLRARNRSPRDRG